MNTRLQSLLLAVVVVLVPTVVMSANGPREALQARTPLQLADFQRTLERMTRDGGTWIASNAQYAVEDGGILVYGMRHRMLNGGVSATGCLWGERDGSQEVYWHFFTAWDPVQRRAILYQSHGNGTIGIGTYADLAADTLTSEQTFTAPGGAEWRVRHVQVSRGDTSFTQSFDHDSTRWVPRRSYTWVRSAVERVPC